MASAFLSHDWGVDKGNHARVIAVAKSLRYDYGIKCWVDDTHMRAGDNLMDKMCKGIEQSDVFVVFVTEAYIDKVHSENQADNVRREFYHALNQQARMLPVRFSPTLPRIWKGPVGMQLSSHMYVDLSCPIEALPDKVGLLATAINNMSKNKPVSAPPPPPVPLTRTSSSEMNLRTRALQVAQALEIDTKGLRLHAILDRADQTLDMKHQTGDNVNLRLNRLEEAVGL